MRHPVSERGFTLVEILVALVISGILVGVIFQLMEGQSRFVRVQSAREEVQQNARAALDLIGSELRSVPPGDGFWKGDRESLTIRVPRTWGVVCDQGGNNELFIRLPALGGLSTATVSAVADLSAAKDDEREWTDPATATISANPTMSPGCLFAGEAALPAGLEVRKLAFSPALPSLGASKPVRGNIIYLFDRVTYQSGTSTTGPGRWIQRQVNSGTPQPLAGPIAEDPVGLQFFYYDGDSELSVPITEFPGDSETRAKVDRVKVAVHAVSRNRTGGIAATQVDTVVISLRNRS